MWAYEKLSANSTAFFMILAAIYVMGKLQKIEDLKDEIQILRTKFDSEIASISRSQDNIYDVLSDIKSNTSPPKPDQYDPFT